MFICSVLVPMQVRMTMREFLMPVGMYMDKISPKKKIRVKKELIRFAVCQDRVFGTQNNYPAGNLFYYVQVLSAKNQAFPLICPLEQKIN